MSKRLCLNCKRYRDFGGGSDGECLHTPPVFVCWSDTPGDRGSRFEYPHVSETDGCSFFSPHEAKNEHVDESGEPRWCVYLVGPVMGSNAGNFKYSLHYKEVSSKDDMVRFSLDDGTFTKDITHLGAYRNKDVIYQIIERHSKNYVEFTTFE